MTNHTETIPCAAQNATGRHPLSAIRRRLEKLELEHLRRHVTELAERLERAEEERQQLRQDLQQAEEWAVSWRDDCLRMMEESLPEGGAIGLAQDGSLHVMAPVRAPAIGEHWDAQGGIYAGIARGENGAADYHLVLLPGEAESVKWDDAKQWAETASGALPTRREQALLYANLKDHFQSAWYWSCEQLAAYTDCAWMQLFGDGVQSDGLKSYEYRARAVRRLPIQ